MSRFCNLVICPNNAGIKDKNQLLFRLPNNPDIRAKWVEQIKKVQNYDELNPNKKFSLCEIHFNESDIRRNYSKKKIKDDAIPIIE